MASHTPTSSTLITTTPDSSSLTILDRLQNFISENRRAIIIASAAAIVVGGVGVAYYSASSSASSRPTGKKKDKKGKGKKSGKKSPNDADGPVLEKLEPEEPEEEGPGMTPEQLAALTPAERDALAEDLKRQGNSAYTQRKFIQARNLYTRALAIAATPQPMYYSNRAACYMNYRTPDHKRAVEDCNEALKLDKNYIKALNRRANSLEVLGQYEEALRDFTAVTILDNFQNEVVAQAVERVVQKLAEPKAKELILQRGARLPPHTFVDAYFSAFRPREVPALPAIATKGDEILISALTALQARDYKKAAAQVEEALLSGDISFDMGRAEAYNIRGSFRFLWGDIRGAKEDLLEAIKIAPKFTQSYVKIASVYMEEDNATDAFKSFDDAIKMDPKDPDIYYHRGQVHFIGGQFDRAAENYTQSVALDSNFVFSHIQLAVAQYKNEQKSEGMATFRKALKAFPTRSEPVNYYGELLLDQHRYQDAVEKFDRAIELEKANKSSKPLLNVLPMVNKALTIFQWRQDPATAENICREALELDPDCEAAVATMAQLTLQQGKIDTAVRLFRKQTELARSLPELVNALKFTYAAEAQIAFLRNYPEEAKRFMREEGAPAQ